MAQKRNEVSEAIFVNSINKVFSMTCFSPKFYKICKELGLPAGNADYRVLGVKRKCKLIALLLTLVDDRACVYSEKQFLVVRRYSLTALVNATADEDVCRKLLGDEVGKAYSLVNRDTGFENVPRYFFDLVLSQTLLVSDFICMALSNATADPDAMVDIASNLKYKEVVLYQLIRVFFANGASSTRPKLDHLSSVFGNLCQDPFFRSFIVTKHPHLFQEFLMEIVSKRSAVRIKGVIRLVNNCCFEYDKHEWMLSPDVDILSFVLLPITGPETFTPEETEKLPVTVQNMLPQKTREADPLTRRCILDILRKLCTTRKCREILREKNVYLILREYHLWETDEQNKSCIEDVVNFLIRTEEEIGVDDLRTVVIPDDFVAPESN